MRTFRVRAVRIGVLATVLAIVALAVYPFMGGAPEVDTGPYALLVAVAAVGAAGVVILPWARLLQSPVGNYLFYAWSAFDIVLIALAAAASGGGRSPIVLLYFATTLFFVSSYPRVGQAVLLVLTFAAWLLMVGLTGDNPGSGVLVLQFGSLGVVAFLGSFLSGELVQQMRELAGTRSESQRRAKLLETVAGAASSINVLDPDEVLVHVVDAVGELGFDAANLCLFQDDGTTYRVVHGRGLPKEYEEGIHPANIGMPSLVREAGTTVVVNDYAADPRGVPQLRELGFRAVVATPIWDKGEMAAVLVGGTRTQRNISSEEVEAFQLLARQAEVSLANVERFEQERLMVARLAELDGLKRDFIANVSHELRTPLTVIQGMGKTLANRWSEMDEDVRAELLGRVNRNADVLAATINTLLDFSQLEAGRLDAHPEPFDVGELVRRSVDRLGSLFGTREVAVTVEDGLFVFADPRLIERVLDNLVSNAAKHTPDTAHVVVSASTLDGTGQARVAVSDDGPGIAPADLDHLGERFYRGSDVVARRTRGAGLGLAFARQVVELHGEELEIESELGRGSTFAFRLPLVGENERDLTPA
ncbi:MAG: GAF domain-containing protein [Actinobacteria bacterium]|nr:MAG: GAF domain-containing protein [Actinomycetota bacterium]